MNIFSAHNYHDILKWHFEQRCKRNANYSIRAFARDLKMQSSHFNDVFNGRSGLSRQSANKIAQLLKLNNIESQYFVSLVQAHHARGQTERMQTKKTLEHQKKLYGHFTTLELDQFDLISDWRYLAIFEACRLATFEGTLTWLASQLKIDEDETSGCLEHLQKLGYIVFDGKTFTPLTLSISTPTDIPSLAIQNYHLQVLNFATDRLKTIEITKRNYGSAIVAVRSDKIPELKVKFRDFLNETVMSLDGDEKPDSLYYIGLQLFPH